MGKSKYIKILTTKDIDLLKMSKVCGHFNPTQAKELNKTTNARLNQLANSGYLIKHTDVKNGISYTLGKKSLDMLGREHCYNPATFKHDRHLTNYYIEHKADRPFIVSGKDYANTHGLPIKGAPDIVVVREMETVVGVEVITSNYKQEDIQEKITYAEKENIKLELIRR